MVMMGVYGPVVVEGFLVIAGDRFCDIGGIISTVGWCDRHFN
jgi:hypothetical protein